MNNPPPCREALREKARFMVQAGETIKQVAAQLSVSENTLRSWKRRYLWGEVDQIGNILTSLNDQVVALIAQKTKTAADYDEIERLTGIYERWYRLKHQPSVPADLPLDTSDSPYPATTKKTKKKKRGRPAAKNEFTQDDIEILVKAFEKMCFAYQWGWWEARYHDGRLILKSRQIGATYYFAIEALILALTTGNNQIFVSASKKQAAQFRRNIIRFVKQHLDKDLQGDPMRLLVPDSDFTEVYLYFLGTQVSSVQGYSGDLYVDECAWIRNFSGIQEVASGMSLLDKYRETYFTTPSTMDHDFYKFWTGEAYNKGRPKDDQININLSNELLRGGAVGADGYWRQRVTIHDAIERGNTLINLDKAKRKYSPAAFRMLCECMFTDHTKSVFSFKSLQAIMVDATEKWKDFNPLSERPLGEKEVWLGYDPSGDGEDAAAISVLCPPTEDYPVYRYVEIIRIDDGDYDEQAAQVVELMGRYNVTYIGVDNKGVGDGVYKTILKEFPAATALNYSPESKGSMITKMLALIKRGLVEVDNIYEDEFIPAFLAIQRHSTAAGSITYSAKRGEDIGHADVAWGSLHPLDNADFDTMLASPTDETVGDSMMEIF